MFATAMTASVRCHPSMAPRPLHAAATTPTPDHRSSILFGVNGAIVRQRVHQRTQRGQPLDRDPLPGRLRPSVGPLLPQRHPPRVLDLADVLHPLTAPATPREQH